MKLRLNGEPRQVPDGSTLASLLALLQVDPARVATVVNGNVVVRASRGDTTLAEGDVVEIVAWLSGC